MKVNLSIIEEALTSEFMALQSQFLAEYATRMTEARSRLNLEGLDEETKDKLNLILDTVIGYGQPFMEVAVDNLHFELKDLSKSKG